MTTSPRLPFDEEPESADSRIEARDRAGRARAVDPRFNVALEASAGTGKTKVLVDRYVNLLRAGVDPANILAITFTRKAAAEMRERVLASLRSAAERGELTPARWRELRHRTGDIAISTIDAFCLSLLREFPLEADLSPGFSMADETEVPRLVEEALGRALRICRGVARTDAHVALVFAQLRDRRLREGVSSLLNRRLVAPELLAKYLEKGPRDLTLDLVSNRAADQLLSVFGTMPGGLAEFVARGPRDPVFALFAFELRQLETAVASSDPCDATMVQRVFERSREHFLTEAGAPRRKSRHVQATFASQLDYRAHRAFVERAAPRLLEAWTGFTRDLNVLVSRGVWRIYRIAEEEYRRTLDTHAVIDFAEVLLRALALLRQMEEFAQSRYRLESRYHHLLVDEFQDTSRKQWELVSLLVQSWGEGAGIAHTGPLPPSIFIVGDRKQSIYGFRDADVSVLHEASRYLGTLRRDGDVRRTISRSYRSTPPLLAFVNDLCQGFERVSRADAFQYEEEDRFPVGRLDSVDDGAVGLVVGDSPDACAERTANEIASLLEHGVSVRDRQTGVRRAVVPADIAILFRTRDSHREFEHALERVGVPAFVYKGLGFFDAPEIKDVLAVLGYLAEPTSNLRTAAWLRSRFVRLSDDGLRALGPRLAAALTESGADAPSLTVADRAVVAFARAMTARWRPLVDVVLPAELLETVLAESAYMVEIRGPRQRAARENIKKIRALVRRLQNRGYATLGRIVAHLDHLTTGDEATAVVDAVDAVSLMTVHAAKGLEFPVVFVVNLSRGSGSWRGAIRVTTLPASQDEIAVSIGNFTSEADDDDRARAREETKRLVYVALTRARDRLYLSSVLKDGRFVSGLGSLGEVLPRSLQLAFEQAVGSDHVPWPGGSGTIHGLRVAGLQPSGASHLGATAEPSPAFESAPEWRLVPRLAVSDVQPAEPEGRVYGRGVSDRLVGTLVHRLIERCGLETTDADEVLLERLVPFIRPEERLDIADLDALLSSVVRAFRWLAANANVRALYGRGQPLHEVPFSLETPHGIVRGTLDCLLTMPGGRVVVLEFKTGRRRPEHQTQIDVYAAAMRLVFPDAVVETQLIYVPPEGATSESGAESAQDDRLK